MQVRNVGPVIYARQLLKTKTVLLQTTDNLYSTCPVIWGISGSETSSKFAEEILFPEER
jgi:hypothetical protein